MGLVKRRLLKTGAWVATASMLATGAGVLGAVGAGIVAGTPAFAGTPGYKAQCTGVPLITKLTLSTTVTGGRLTPTTVSNGDKVTAKTLVLKIKLSKSLATIFSGKSFGATVTMGATVSGATPASAALTFSENSTIPAATTIPSTGLKLTAPGTLTPSTLTVTGTSGTVTLSQEASTATKITASITVTLAGSAEGPYDCTIPKEIIASVVPAITSTSLAAATLGTAYSETLAATGGTTPYTWSATGLPGGLGISATGKITGTPTAAGTFTVELTVTDHNAKKATATLKLSVITNIPAVATRSLPGGKVGTVYATTLAAHGGSGAQTWSASGLPSGLKLTTTGLISGTPRTAGTFTVAVTATFKTSAKASSTLHLAVAPPPAPAARTTGYWATAADGGVFNYGPAAPYYGSMGGKTLNAPIVGLAGAPGGTGYWLVASDGGVFAFGSAAYEGSMGGKTLNAPVVGMAATPTGTGYWLVASDGGVFAFGAAQYQGSMGGKTLDQPVVGLSATPTGTGYWLVAADGGVFAFGGAQYQGSMGGKSLDAPIVGLSATPTGSGYWLVGADGGVFSFGSATYYGSTGGMTLNAPVVGVANGPATATATFSAHGSIDEAYVLGATPGQHLTVYNAAGDQVGSGTADHYGSLIVHTLAPGAGYVVRSTRGRITESTPSFTVQGTNTVPTASFYSDQHLHAGLNYITMRDGVTLAATVRLPPGKTITQGPFPTVIEDSGYSIGGPATLIQSILHPGTPTIDPTLLPSGSTAVGSALAPLLGFATVSLQMRGTGCSGGAFDLFNAPTIHDGYDAVQIVGSQSWVSNHKVGLVGISFSGISQLFVAGTEPPDLAAIAPMSPTDTLYSTGFPGGMFNNGFAESWINERVSTAQAAPTGGQGWAKAEIKDGTLECLANQRLRDQIQTIYGELKQGNYKTSPLYSSRGMDQWISKINVPVFLSGALQDTETGPQWPNLISSLSNDHTVWVTMVNGAHIDSIGPGAFTRWVEFLDLYVADQPAHITATVDAVSSLIYQYVAANAPSEPLPALKDTGPTVTADRQQYAAQNQRVTVLFTNGGGTLGAGAFQPLWTAGFSSWPPAQAKATTYDLGSGGALSSAPASTATTASFKPTPTARPATDITPPGGTSFGATPNYNWTPVTGSEGLGFVSGPLTETMVSVGPASLDLYLESTAADTDLEATISEVMPTGKKEEYVTSGFLRASDRALTAAASTATQPVPTYAAATVSPLPQTTMTLVRIPIDPLGFLFRKGGRIRVTISAPGGTRPQWAFTTFKTGGKVTDTVGLGGAKPSALVLSLEPTVTPPTITPLPVCGSLRGQPCRTYVPAGNGG